MASDQTKVLSAVYRNYFPMVPSNIKKGSSNVKGMFKGEYQIYPTISTISLSNLSEGGDIHIRVELVYNASSGTLEMYIRNYSGYLPSFNVTPSLQYEYYASYSYHTDYYTPTYTVAAGTYYINVKYTIATSLGSSYTLTDYIIDNHKDYNGIRYYFYPTYGSQNPDGFAPYGESVYKFDIGIENNSEANFSNKVYCAANAFSITYETSRPKSGTSSYTTINFPATNNGTSSFGYLYGTYLYLYDKRLPTLPTNNEFVQFSGGTTVAATVNGTNDPQYPLSAYFNNKTFSTLANYYKNLTDGDTSKINLFDYGVVSSKLTNYRYEFNQLQLYNSQRNTSSAYMWDLDNASISFTLTPYGNNYTNGFYVLGFFVTPQNANFYVHFMLQEGGNIKSEKTTNIYNSNDALANSTTYHLNRNKVDLWESGTWFTSGLYGIVSTNAVNPYNLGTSPRSITLTGLRGSSQIYKSGYKIKIGNGIDIVSTWGWCNHESGTTQSASDYIQSISAPTSLSDKHYMTVYCICWSGFVGQKSHQMSAYKVGSLIIPAKTKSTTDGVTFYR